MMNDEIVAWMEAVTQALECLASDDKDGLTAHTANARRQLAQFRESLARDEQTRRAIDDAT